MWFTILAESRKHNVVIAAVCFFVSKIVGTTNNWAGANLTGADSQRHMQMTPALSRRDGSSSELVVTSSDGNYIDTIL